MTKQITRVWSFASDSNPNIEFETMQYADGTSSCNGKGWTRRVAPDGSRSCKHTRAVDIGTANDHCTATYTNAMARLQAKGVKFIADRILREIALEIGYDRPYEILHILESRR